jgi:hypothetical protein
MNRALALAAVCALGAAGSVAIVPAETQPEDIGGPIPDRVSIEQDSPHFFPAYAMLGVKVNGKDSNQVVEFCQSEGWARLCLRNGKGVMKRDSRGKPITTTVAASIDPYWRDTATPGAAVVTAPVAETRRDPDWVKPELSREQVRRQRQAAAREAKLAKRQA